MKKANFKGHVLYDSRYMTFSTRQNHRGGEQTGGGQVLGMAGRRAQGAGGGRAPASCGRSLRGWTAPCRPRWRSQVTGRDGARHEPRAGVLRCHPWGKPGGGPRDLCAASQLSVTLSFQNKSLKMCQNF